MTTLKSIMTKIARREAKLTELSAEREKLLDEIRAINARPRFTWTVYQDALSKSLERDSIQKKLTPINKSIDKLHRELRTLQSELQLNRNE